MMLTEGNLTKFTLRLTARGPIFIGSGSKVNKKEYSFNPRTQEITFYDTQKLFECVVQNKLVDAYEAYMLGSARSLYDFIRENGGPNRFQMAQSYKTMGGDAIFGVGGQPAEINTFIRGADAKPYIPGSSIKGMLRTAITAALVLEKTPRTPKPIIGRSIPVFPGFPPDASEIEKKNIKKAFSSTQKQFHDSIEREGKYVTKRLDEELFHTLHFDEKKPENAVNSIFRGLIVADSRPLGNQNLILCRKLDLHPQGGTNEIDLVRECLRPGVAVDVPVTVDRTLAGGITPEFIAQAIASFDEWYADNVFSHYKGCQFTLPELTHHLFLGGGSGYQSKTVTGPWLGDDALEYIRPWMISQFDKKSRNNEKHGNDDKLGISPHMLKYTTVNRQKYLFGLCEVNIL